MVVKQSVLFSAHFQETLTRQTKDAIGVSYLDTLKNYLRSITVANRDQTLL